jgi:hypothetical protein
MSRATIPLPGDPGSHAAPRRPGEAHRPGKRLPRVAARASALVLLAGVITAFGSGATSSASTTIAPSGITPSGTSTQGTGASPTRVAYLPSGLPVPSIAGLLHIGTIIPLNLHWSTFEGLQPDPVTAEAPDGAVYVSTGSVVYVVDGNAAPHVAVHAASRVLALAADATGVYVETGLAVTAYDRRSGDKVRTWDLPGASAPTAAGLLAEPGALWSWTEKSGSQYATLSRMGAFGVKLVDQNVAYPGLMAADASGLYFQSANPSAPGGHLAEVAPSGALTLSSAPFELGSTIALSEGKLVVEAPPGPNGKGLWQTWGPSTLRPLTSSGPRPQLVSGIEDTGAGLLGYTRPVGPLGPYTAVSRVDVATGAPGSTVQFFSNFSWLLEGYYPAIVNEASGELYIVRLATAAIPVTPSTASSAPPGGQSWSLDATRPVRQ